MFSKHRRVPSGRGFLRDKSLSPPDYRDLYLIIYRQTRQGSAMILFSSVPRTQRALLKGGASLRRAYCDVCATGMPAPLSPEGLSHFCGIAFKVVKTSVPTRRTRMKRINGFKDFIYTVYPLHPCSQVSPRTLPARRAF